MTLDEFIQSEKESLERFARYWSGKAQHSPDIFPLEMPSGEWDEQFTFFKQDV